jgi:hypothetical protein
MFSRPAFFIWVLAGPVLAGVLITVLLLIPAAQPNLGALIVGASVFSLLAAVPFARAVGRAMSDTSADATPSR